MNYPELGGVETKRTFYAEGTMIAYPSGAVHQRINGNGTLVIRPGDGAEDGPER